MDVAIILDKLVPAAKYGGTLVNNTRAEYDALAWEDEREKPSWSEVESEGASVLLDDAKKSKVESLKEYYLQHKYFSFSVSGTVNEVTYNIDTFDVTNEVDFLTMQSDITFDELVLEYNQNNEKKIAHASIKTENIKTKLNEIRSRKAKNKFAKDFHTAVINSLQSVPEVEAYDYTAPIDVDGVTYQIESGPFTVDLNDTGWDLNIL